MLEGGGGLRRRLQDAATSLGIRGALCARRRHRRVLRLHSKGRRAARAARVQVRNSTKGAAPAKSSRAITPDPATRPLTPDRVAAPHVIDLTRTEADKATASAGGPEVGNGRRQKGSAAAKSRTVRIAANREQVPGVGRSSKQHHGNHIGDAWNERPQPPRFQSDITFGSAATPSPQPAPARCRCSFRHQPRPQPPPPSPRPHPHHPHRQTAHGCARAPATPSTATP